MKGLRPFCLVLLLADPAAAAQPENCALKEVGSLVMETQDPDRVIVALSIAGKPSRFEVDTGGVFTSVFQDVADRLGLRPRSISQQLEIYNVNGSRSRRYVDLPDLAIGTIKGDNIPVLVRPRGPNDDPQLDGILGPDILSRFDVDFDFAAHKLNLFSQDHCEGKVVYWADAFANADFDLRTGHIVLSMTLDGKDVTATLDTGSPETHLYDAVARYKFGLDDTTLEPIPGVSPGSLEKFQHSFKSLSIGGLGVGNPLIYILPDLAERSFEHNHLEKEQIDPQYAQHLETTDMLLGMDVLSKLHLYVAYKEHKIYLTAAGAH
jgi:predicted aspartyl protease